MQTTFSVNFILHSSFSVMGFSLPVMIPSPFLLWSFEGFGVFFPSSDCRNFFFLERRLKVRILLKFGGDSPKTCIFPFTEDFPSSLPTILGNDQMRQLPAVHSPASCSRTLAAGWPSQVSFQLVLDTKEHELLLHP